MTIEKPILSAVGVVMVVYALAIFRGVAVKTLQGAFSHNDLMAIGFVSVITVFIGLCGLGLIGMASGRFD